MKSDHKFSKRLKQIISTTKLPGIDAQLMMAPETRRKEMVMATPTPTSPRKSAVLMCFFEKKEEPHFIMIKRALDNSVHSGQIAFPGGKYEKSDKTLTQTALRESHEEIGLLPSSVEIIGSLSQLYIPPSNFMVVPYIGFLQKEPVLITNEEVDKLLIVSLSELLNPTTQSVKEIEHRLGKFKVPCYTLNGEIVWGATAMMLAEFIELMNTNKQA